MPLPTDTLDITLLRSNRHEFVLQCQRIIEIVVKHFTKRGMFPPSQYDDVIQSANEELIKRLDLIERNFDGSVQLNTYMNVVIRNICYRIHEQERNHIQTESLTDEMLPRIRDHSEPMMIQDELRRFGTALQLCGTKRSKTILCLKIYFRLPASVQELKDHFRDLPPEDIEALRQLFGVNFDDTLEFDNFNAVAPFMNKQEKNKTSGSSIRRWTQESLSRIIALMNGTPPVKTHTKETVKILLEHYLPTPLH